MESRAQLGLGRGAGFGGGLDSVSNRRRHGGVKKGREAEDGAAVSVLPQPCRGKTKRKTALRRCLSALLSSKYQYTDKCWCWSASYVRPTVQCCEGTRRPFQGGEDPQTGSNTHITPWPRAFLPNPGSAGSTSLSSTSPQYMHSQLCIPNIDPSTSQNPRPFLLGQVKVHGPSETAHLVDGHLYIAGDRRTGIATLDVGRKRPGRRRPREQQLPLISRKPSELKQGTPPNLPSDLRRNVAETTTRSRDFQQPMYALWIVYRHS